MKELHHAELVEKIKDGRRVTLQINPQRLKELRDFFELKVDQSTEEWMKANALGY